MAWKVLTLILFITLAVNQFGAADPPPSRADSESDPRPLEEETLDRSSMASAKAYAYQIQGVAALPTLMAQNTVQCAACSGCPTGKNATTKYCPVSPDPLKNGRCVVYFEKYGHMQNPWVVRGCASERGNCAEIKEAHARQTYVQLLYCADCEGDRCNGVGHSSLDLLAALASVVIMPMLMKHTLA